MYRWPLYGNTDQILEDAARIQSSAKLLVLNCSIAEVHIKTGHYPGSLDEFGSLAMDPRLDRPFAYEKEKGGRWTAALYTKSKPEPQPY